MGMRIHAINRRGRSDEPTDWIGSVDDLDLLLAAADVLIVSTPLTPATKDLIGARELGLMKPDAILVNLARGEIIQEAPLFAHLQSQPRTSSPASMRGGSSRSGTARSASTIHSCRCPTSSAHRIIRRLSLA